MVGNNSAVHTRARAYTHTYTHHYHYIPNKKKSFLSRKIKQIFTSTMALVSMLCRIKRKIHFGYVLTEQVRALKIISNSWCQYYFAHTENAKTENTATKTETIASNQNVKTWKYFLFNFQEWLGSLSFSSYRFVYTSAHLS